MRPEGCTRGEGRWRRRVPSGTRVIISLTAPLSFLSLATALSPPPNCHITRRFPSRRPIRRTAARRSTGTGGGDVGEQHPDISLNLLRSLHRHLEFCRELDLILDWINGGNDLFFSPSYSLSLPIRWYLRGGILTRGRRSRGHRAECTRDGGTRFTQLRNTCTMTGPTATCMELSGRFHVVTMSCGCASRAPGIRLIKTLGSRVYRESPSRITDSLAMVQYLAVHVTDPPSIYVVLDPGSSWASMDPGYS